MNQAERTCPVRARTCTLGNASNFSGFQLIASLQLRNLGRAGVEADVAVWWPLTLRISSERYVVCPRQSGESAASPKLYEVYQNPRRWGRGNVANVKVLPIPMLPVFIWGAAGMRRLEGGFPS